MKINDTDLIFVLCVAVGASVFRYSSSMELFPEVLLPQFHITPDKG